MVEAEAAQEAVAALQAEPRGVVRITCPITLLHVHVGPMLARFMARYPGINLQLEATNRRVDPWERAWISRSASARVRLMTATGVKGAG